MSRNLLLLTVCAAGALCLPACTGRRPLLSSSPSSLPAIKGTVQPLESHGPRTDPSLRPAVVEVAAGQTLPAELSLGDWRPVGPWNFAGKAFDVAVSPADPSTVYAAYGFAGIWKTADGGKSWLQLNDPGDLHQFPCVTVHPRFPDVLAACLGEPDFPVFRKGLLYSADGGRHWDLTAPADGLSSSFYRAVFHPDDPNVLYAASDKAVYVTRDRGAHWDRILTYPGTGPDSWDQMPDLVMKPDDPSVLIAAQKNLGVYRTADGGATWVRVDQAMDTTSITSILAWSPSDPNTVYCQRNNPDGKNLITYSSANAGVTWTRVNQVPLRTQSRYDMSMAVDPAAPSRVLLGNADFGVSVDGIHSIHSPAAPPHQDHLRVVFDPSNSDVVYGASDGGIWRSTDRGETWSRFDTGVDTNLSYGFDVDTSTGAIYLSSGDYIPTQQYNSANGWAYSSVGGEWATFYVDPNDAATVWNASGDNLAVSHDHGQTWRSFDPDKGAPRPGHTVLRFEPGRVGTMFFTTDKVWVSHDSRATWAVVARSSNGWITDLLFDPSLRGTIYVSENGGILTSADDGVTWTETKASAANGLPYNCREMAPAYGKPGTFYMSDNSQVLLVTNGGKSAQPLPGTPFSNNKEIQGIATDPNHPERLFVAGSAGLFFSQNYGQTWQRLGRNLPASEVWEILIKGNSVYVGTQHSIWQFNSDVSWQASPPANFAAKPLSPTSVALSWAAATGSAGVRVYRDGAQTYAGNDNAFIDTGLTPSAPYCYSALDRNSAGDGRLSSPVCVTTPAASASPSIALSTSTLQFAYVIGGKLPAGATLQVNSAAAGTLSWTGTVSVPWITLAPGSGRAPSALGIGINNSALSLPAGTYSGTVSLAAAGASTQSVSVLLTVTGGAVNAAGNQTVLAPGALATLYGTSFTKPASVFSNLQGTSTPGGLTVGLYGDGPNSYALGYSFAAPLGSDYVFAGATYFGSFAKGTNDLVLSLCSDSNGAPGAILESQHFVNVLSSTPGLVQFVSDVHPTLTGGHQYWLTAAMAYPAASASVWWISPSDSGLFSGSTNGGPWSSVPTASRGAFAITATLKAGAVPLPTSLGGVSLSIGGRAAPVLYVSPSQINFQVPYDIQPGSSVLTVTANAVPGTPIPVSVAAAAPGIFAYGNNWAIVQNSDYSLNSVANPAKLGSYVTVYWTGGGPVNPPVVTGSAAPDSPLSTTTAAVTASINGVPATVVFAGLTPGSVGLLQANVQIPAGLASGTYSIQISAGGGTSNTPSIAVVQ